MTTKGSISIAKKGFAFVFTLVFMCVMSFFAANASAWQIVLIGDAEGLYFEDETLSLINAQNMTMGDTVSAGVIASNRHNIPFHLAVIVSDKSTSNDYCMIDLGIMDITLRRESPSGTILSNTAFPQGLQGVLYYDLGVIAPGDALNLTVLVSLDGIRHQELKDTNQIPETIFHGHETNLVWTFVASIDGVNPPNVPDIPGGPSAPGGPGVPGAPGIPDPPVVVPAAVLPGAAAVAAVADDDVDEEQTEPVPDSGADESGQELQEIEDDDTALADTDFDADITDDGDIPLGPGARAWALVNLILAVCGVISIGVTSIYAALKRKSREEREPMDEYPIGKAAGGHAADKTTMDGSFEEDGKAKRRMRPAWAVIGVVMAAIGVILFILTQDITLPMALVDKWTIAHVIIFAVIITAIMLLFVKYAIVYFEPNGSGEAFKAKVRLGKKAQFPEISKRGYRFVGWYTDDALMRPWNFESKVDRNMKLYAKWEKISPDSA